MNVMMRMFKLRSKKKPFGEDVSTFWKIWMVCREKEEIFFNEQPLAYQVGLCLSKSSHSRNIVNVSA